jgi:citrate synthase
VLGFGDYPEVIALTMLHDRFAAGLDGLRGERRELIERYGDRVISEVSVAAALGGLRGVRAMVCDTSVVDPDTGLIIRGRPVLDLADRLPEEVFFLLLTGELPSPQELAALRAELNARAAIPDTVWNVVRAMPPQSHPMSLLAAGLAALEHESEFRRRYGEGLAPGDLWRPALDDAVALLARLPGLAAGVYRLRYDKGDPVEWSDRLDWAANYGRMLGIEDDTFAAAMRLAAVVQSDHEGGNVCAFACHTVGSVLSNPYLAVAAGFNGLAGPLHGLASQVSARWVLAALDRYGGVPDERQISDYAWETLNAGGVVPGYGHAVLRGPDPRFTALVDFCRRRLSHDDMVATVVRMADVIPQVLKEHGKAKNPYPNVDAGTGAVWHHFGITELPYYTVPFAISLALGMVAQLVINRALRSPIVRPRSVTSAWIRNHADD